MSDFYGVRFREVPTSLLAPVRVNASLLMAFGTAPIHRLPADQQEKVKPGSLVLAFSNAEASQQLGIDGGRDNPLKWGLSEVAYNKFSLFNQSPVIFVNLFDPAVHRTSVTGEVVIFDVNMGVLSNDDVIGDVTLSSGGTTFTLDTDYYLNSVTGVIDVVSGSSLASAISLGTNPITASYVYADPSKVTNEDCIGGYDVVTGKTTGLELVEQAFPQLRMVPGILYATNFTHPMVTSVLCAKTENINGVFKAGIAVANVPDDAVDIYTDLPKWKNDNSLVSENLYLCVGRVIDGERTYNTAVQAACLMGVVDARRQVAPYESPSNENLRCQGWVLNGAEVNLTLPQANFLRGNGLSVPLNFIGGWRLWNSWTAAYPGISDPKDSLITHRRMMAWYGNGLVLTYFQVVDSPFNRRLIETIINSEQINLNSLVSAGALIDGVISFNEADNPLTDLMQGFVKFDVKLGLVSPAQRIDFSLEFDPEMLLQLF